MLNFLDWDIQYANIMNSYSTAIDSGGMIKNTMFDFYKTVDFTTDEGINRDVIVSLS